MQRLPLFLVLMLLTAGCARPAVPQPPPPLIVEEYPIAGLPAPASDHAQAVTVEMKARRKEWREPSPEKLATLPDPEPPIVDQQARGNNMNKWPVNAGGQITHLNWDWPSKSIQVVQGGTVVYAYRVERSLASHDQSAISLNVWNGQWVLETRDATVIVGGRNLNEELGFGQIFDFHMIAGKPFFFFQREGKVGMWYDGIILPQQYDAVHHYGCCDMYTLNPQASHWMIYFYARRNDQWHYVEAGLYD